MSGIGNLQNARSKRKWMTEVTLGGIGGGDGVSPSNSLPLSAGTAASGSSLAYARGDHRHPLQDVSGKQDATLSAGSFGSGSVARTVTDKLGETVSVRDFGAVADSATGNAAAFQAANNAVAAAGGGTVLVPRAPTPGAWYRLEYPVQVASNVTFEGEGYGSYIRNTAADFVTGTPFLLGTFHPAFFPSSGGTMVVYNIADTVAGVDSVVPDTAADALNFAVGDLAYVWSDNSFQRLGVVKAVASGLVTFEWPFDCAFETVGANSPWISKFAGASDTPTVGPSVPCAMIRNAGVRNMRIHSVNGNHFARSAVLDGTFERLWLTGTTSLIGGNAFTRCSFRGLRGNFAARLIEVADGGWGNLFEDVQAEWLDKGLALTATNCVKLGHKGVLRDFRLVDGANRSSAAIFVSTFGELVENGEVVVSGTYSRIFSWESSATSTLNFNDDGIYRNIAVLPFGAPTLTRMARLASTETKVRRATLDNVRSDITPTNALGVAIEAGDAVLAGCRLPNTIIGLSAGIKVRFTAPCDIKLRTTDLALLNQQSIKPALDRATSANFAGLYLQSIPGATSVTVETTLVSGSAAFPNIIYRGDKLRLRLPLAITGTAGTKMLKVTFCGTAFSTFTLLAATVGDMVLECEFTCVADNGQTWRCEARLHGNVTDAYRYDVMSKTPVNPATTAIDYIIAAWVTVGTDAITPSFYEARPALVGAT